VAAALIRSLLTVVLLVALYYALPLRGVHDRSDVVTLILGVGVLVGWGVFQVRRTLHSRHPGLRAVQALCAVVPLFLLCFAAVYYAMEHNHPSDFSSRLTRTDSLYFTVTVFTTVGFGDIVAKTQVARILVTLQMIGDLVIIGVFVRVITSAVERGQKRILAERINAGSDSPPPDRERDQVEERS